MYNWESEHYVKVLNGLNTWVAFVGGLTWLLSIDFSAALIGGFLCNTVLLLINSANDVKLLKVFENTTKDGDIISRSIGFMVITDEGKRASFEWNLGLQAVIHYHYSYCGATMCPITQFLKHPSEKLDSNASAVHSVAYAIIRKLKLVMAEFPEKFDIKLFTIGYAISCSKSWMLAHELINIAQCMEINLFQRFLLFCFW